MCFVDPHPTRAVRYWCSCVSVCVYAPTCVCASDLCGTGVFRVGFFRRPALTVCMCVYLSTRGALTRLQTTFSHCFLTLETTKKRLETRDYKKMRFRRSAAVTFFFGRRLGSPGKGIPNFPPRCARLKKFNRNKAYASLYIENFPRCARQVV